MLVHWNKVLLAALLVSVTLVAVPIGRAGPPSEAAGFCASGGQVDEAAQKKADGTELRLVETKEGIATRHVRYQQYVNGLPVEGAFVTEHVDIANGLVKSVTDRSMKVGVAPATNARLGSEGALARAKQAVSLVEPRGDATAELVYFPSEQELRLAWKVMVPALDPLGTWLVYIDALNGEVLYKIDVLRRDCTSPSSPGGCVFDPNPVTTQGSCTGLADNGDACYAQLTGLRQTVSLPGLHTSGNPLCQLIGDYVDLTAPGIVGAYRPAGVCQSCSWVYPADRCQACFEEVMNYYHVDVVQRLIQSLGFVGATGIYQAPIPVHAHYMPDDNAFYDPADRGLHFGDGGVDDGEDADIIVHEYGHALLDDQVPGIYTEEGGAVHEGFSDLLSALMFFDSNPAWDPACLGEWDATYYLPGCDCLRRADGNKHYPEDMVGEVHEDGEIWSGAMWAVFQAFGGNQAARDKTLRLELEGHFYLDPGSGLLDAAAAVIDADEALYGGADVPLLESIFQSRGLRHVLLSDDFDEAIAIDPLPFDHMQGTGDATVAPDDPLISCVWDRSHTVWYRLQTPATTLMAMNTFGSTYDTVLAVYTGTRGSLTQVVCNDDTDGFQSRVEFTAQAGVTYHIMVASYSSGPGGTLQFHAGAMAPNDDFADAIVIAALPYANAGDTCDATIEPGEPSCACGSGSIEDTVWYKYTAGTDVILDANTFGSGYDTELRVYSGPDPATFGDLTCVGCNDDTGSLQSQVVFPAQAGTTYYFQIDGFFGNCGDLQFNLAEQPRGDVLVYSDDGVTSPTAVEEALSNLGISFTLIPAGDFLAFEDELAAGGYQLVIFDDEMYFPLESTYAALTAYVNGGGKLLVKGFEQDLAFAASLSAAMGAQWQSDLQLPVPIIRRQPAHAVFNVPNAVPDLTQAEDWYIDDGDYMSALAGAQCLAGSASGSPVECLIVARDDQQTILNSFLPGDYQYDEDGDGKRDVVELIENEISWLYGPGDYHTLTMAAAPVQAGTTDPAPGPHDYLAGTVVPIEPLPNPGWCFDGWTGDSDCADGSVTMNHDMTCTANFSDCPPTVLRIEPPAKDCSLSGGACSVDVYVVDVANLGSFEVTLDFSTGIAQFDHFEEGSFLGSTGRTTQCSYYHIADGSEQYGCASGGDQPGPTGTGVLARVFFTPAAEGQTPLDLHNTALYDASPYVNPIPHTVQDGLLRVWACRADVDRDGDVDIRDVGLVFAHWPSPPKPYDQAYDMDMDGDIDIRDVALVFNQWPAPPRTCTL